MAVPQPSVGYTGRNAGILFVSHSNISMMALLFSGRPWREDTFGHVFAAIRDADMEWLPLGHNGGPRLEAEPRKPAELIGPRPLDGLIFKYLRHTAILALDRAECTSRQIGTITGHSEKSILSTLRHYQVQDEQVAVGALQRRLNVEAKGPVGT